MVDNAQQLQGQIGTNMDKKSGQIWREHFSMEGTFFLPVIWYVPRVRKFISGEPVLVTEGMVEVVAA